MNKLLYYGWLGKKNIGDESLFLSSKRIYQDISFTFYKSLFKWFNRYKACILGGGTYINEKASVRSIKAIQAKMPFIIFGAGVQNPSFWNNINGHLSGIKEWNDILKMCPFVGVRGPHSIKTLINQGITNAIMIGDPVLSLSSEIVKRKSNSHIGINFGNTAGYLWGGNDTVVFDFFHSLIEILIKDGFRVSLFATCPSDTRPLSIIRREFGIDELHTFYKYGLVSSYLQNVDVFIGMKLHSVILAHCVYTPSIMIEYRPKCADYMASMGLDEYNFRCDKLNVDRVYSKITQLLQKSIEHQDSLYNHIIKFKQIQRNFADEIIDYITNI